MIIFVDAYNFIKTAMATTYVSDAELQRWIGWFSRYARLKKHTIILVFDAGPDHKRFVEKRDCVQIIYSGQDSSADAELYELLEKNKDKDVLLVTSDREICVWAAARQIEFVTSQEFYSLTDYSRKNYNIEVPKNSSTLYKNVQTSTDIDNDLDSLYEDSTKFLHKGVIKQEDDELQHYDVEYQKISKKNKKKMQKIAKL